MLNRSARINFKLFIKRILLVLTIAAMAFFGLKTDSALQNNNFSFDSSKSVLIFKPNSMAYTESFPTFNGFSPEAINIDFTIKPDFPVPNRFGLILQIYDMNTDYQISVGQWDSSLVILNNDDYSNIKRLPKIYSPLDRDSDEFHVSIRSGIGGTTVYVNNVQAGHNTDLFLKPPALDNRSHLIVGNGVNGRNPWTGSISSLNIYSDEKQNPLLHYRFDSMESHQIIDLSGKGIPLELPGRIRLLKKEILQFPDSYSLQRNNMKSDLFFNFFGFIPLGFLIAINLKGKKRGAGPFATAALLCLFFSLTIELTQAGLPDRDSSLLDLILNTSGGVIGALTASVKEKLLRSSHKNVNQ